MHLHVTDLVIYSLSLPPTAFCHLFFLVQQIDVATKFSSLLNKKREREREDGGDIFVLRTQRIKKSCKLTMILV